MDLNCKNVLYIVGCVALVYVSLRILQDNCDVGLGGFFQMVEGLENSASVSGGVLASEPAGQNAGPQKVENMGRTPSTCYPLPALKAEDLLPKEDSAGDGILSGVNMLDAGFHVGVNTVGQSLRNANRQLRSEPPNPQVNVSPWMMSSIGPDLLRRPLEDGEGCAASPGEGVTAA
jgi:hypothetical protein